jgi:hypothetical protein
VGAGETLDAIGIAFCDPSVLPPGEKFDLILGSPPYFPPGSGVVGDNPQKVACRFELRGDIADYCATTAPAGLMIIRWRPVTLREPEPSLLGLFCLVGANDVPSNPSGKPWMEPPLVTWPAPGQIHPEYPVVKMSSDFPL